MNTQNELDRLIAEIKKEAFQDGWNAAVRAVTVAANEMADKPATRTGSRLKKPATKQRQRRRLKAGAAPSTVVAILQNEPGLTGAGIIAAANKGKAEGRAVAERTIRTALARLKASEKIVQIENRWYLPRNAPTNTTQQDTAGRPESQPAVVSSTDQGGQHAAALA